MDRLRPPKPSIPKGWPLQPLSLIAYLAVGVGLGILSLRWQVAESLQAGQVLIWADFTTPLWTIAIGILTNVSCALLGCYLVLRRMSLLGDAISHSVLPGLAIGFLLTGELTGWPMFLGAMVLGVLTSVLTQVIANLGKVSEDTSMGVVFTSLFAVGVVLIMAFARRAHIDAECILYGQIDYAALNLPVANWPQVPAAVWTLSATLAATLLYVLVLWKELKIVAFDPALAAAMGLSVPVVHYSLMAMVACVSVASFEAVGSILVVAMLIVPAATAALVTDRLSWMLAWAATFGIVSAVFGYVLAAATATSVAGMMAVVAGVQLAVAVVLGPNYGLVSRWLRNLSLAVRIASEDVIARLYREEERRGQGSGLRVQESGVGSRESGVGGLVRWLAGWRLARENWVLADQVGSLRLTNEGRTAARNLVRAHRLWEAYLDTHFDLPRDHLHDAAERMEHFLDPQLQAELDAELAGVQTDPHGKAIPRGDD
ncbi:MAG: metal ABC transporter permease [Planctomycetaceae bacterium]|nr:metal ABC transporter permease [Planctomycetaceae bacterium]